MIVRTGVSPTSVSVFETISESASRMMSFTEGECSFKAMRPVALQASKLWAAGCLSLSDAGEQQSGCQGKSVCERPHLKPLGLRFDCNRCLLGDLMFAWRSKD